jgi:hypothetical protein
VIKAVGADLLVVQLVEFGSDVVHVLLQIKPVLVGYHQVLPFLLGLDSPLTQTQQNSIEFLSQQRPVVAQGLQLLGRYLRHLLLTLVPLPSHEDNLVLFGQTEVSSDLEETQPHHTQFPQL